EYGLPVLAVTAVGKELEKRDARYLSLACRIAAEHGARLVKTYFCEGFDKVAGSCPVPVIIAGGPKLETDLDALEMTRDALEAGAVGVDMGRNIWQHDTPAPMIRAVRAIVREGDLPPLRPPVVAPPERGVHGRRVRRRPEGGGPVEGGRRGLHPRDPDLRGERELRCGLRPLANRLPLRTPRLHRGRGRERDPVPPAVHDLRDRVPRDVPRGPPEAVRDGLERVHGHSRVRVHRGDRRGPDPPGDRLEVRERDERQHRAAD